MRLRKQRYRPTTATLSKPSIERRLCSASCLHCNAEPADAHPGPSCAPFSIACKTLENRKTKRSTMRWTMFISPTLRPCMLNHRWTAKNLSSSMATAMKFGSLKVKSLTLREPPGTHSKASKMVSDNFSMAPNTYRHAVTVPSRPKLNWLSFWQESTTNYLLQPPQAVMELNRGSWMRSSLSTTQKCATLEIFENVPLSPDLFEKYGYMTAFPTNVPSRLLWSRERRLPKLIYLLL